MTILDFRRGAREEQAEREHHTDEVAERSDHALERGDKLDNTLDELQRAMNDLRRSARRAGVRLATR